MGLLADRARSIIASSKLSPVEKNIIVRTLLIASHDPENAAREILRRVERDGVPLEEALRRLKHDWYRILELLSTEIEIDGQVKQNLVSRDSGQCCLTGATLLGTEPQPFHILSPALRRLWLRHGCEPSIVSCLEALITPKYSKILRQALGDTSPYSQLENTMLLNPTVGQAFCKRDIWLIPQSTRRSSSAEASKESQTQDAQYAVFGFAPDDDSSDESVDDGVQLFACTLHTKDLALLPLPNPVLFKIHSLFAKATESNDIEREVARPWPPAVSPFSSPLFVDLMPLVADGKPWLIMTSLPGQRLDEVIHRMSYPERHKLADDLAAAVHAYRAIPNTSGLLIVSASGGRLQDPRASANACGPFQSEAGFNKQIAQGCMEDLARAFPGAQSRVHSIVFTHADLFPSNILVDAGRLSGIVDWQFAGFFPAYWEYTKAMRSVRHTEQYQAIFRRIFSEYEDELEVEEYLSGYFPIVGPREPVASEDCAA